MNRQDAKTAKEEPSEELDRLAHAVIGAAIKVHRHLGPGFLESVYQKGLEIELRSRGIPAEPQYHVRLSYKGEPVGEDFLDFLVGGALVVELKAVDALAPIHKAQVISYLRATGLRLALLINFNVPVLREGIRRVIWNEPIPNPTEEDF
jgi:GxxExxY protein